MEKIHVKGRLRAGKKKKTYRGRDAEKKTTTPVTESCWEDYHEYRGPILRGGGRTNGLEPQFNTYKKHTGQNPTPTAARRGREKAGKSEKLTHLRVLARRGRPGLGQPERRAEQGACKEAAQAN